MTPETKERVEEARKKQILDMAVGLCILEDKFPQNRLTQGFSDRAEWITSAHDLGCNNYFNPYDWKEGFNWRDGSASAETEAKDLRIEIQAGIKRDWRHFYYSQYHYTREPVTSLDYKCSIIASNHQVIFSGTSHSESWGSEINIKRERRNQQEIEIYLPGDWTNQLRETFEERWREKRNRQSMPYSS
jgi:hypothetical protein